MKTPYTPLEQGRKQYDQGALHRSDLPDSPIDLLRAWLKLAEEVVGEDFQAMVLGTLDASGFPTGRVVLARGLDEEGIRFFTNYQSEKARNLQDHPQASATFFWKELERQVRVRGVVRKLSVDDSDRYFASRPRESQLGAWMSPQSEVIPDEMDWESSRQTWEQRFRDLPDIPRPPHWGGFVLSIQAIEFWQGRPNRLHDRWEYALQSSGVWQIVRRSP